MKCEQVPTLWNKAAPYSGDMAANIELSFAR